MPERFRGWHIVVNAAVELQGFLKGDARVAVDRAGRETLTIQKSLKQHILSLTRGDNNHGGFRRGLGLAFFRRLRRRGHGVDFFHCRNFQHLANPDRVIR